MNHTISTHSRTPNIVSLFLLGAIVSCYYFPFGLTFLPQGLNTKMMLAAVGVFFFMYECIESNTLRVAKDFIPTVILAVLFSLVGYVSMDINNSTDSAYANYFVSFGTWMFGAYATIYLLKFYHSNVSFVLIMNYLASICVGQCVIALAIDNYDPLKLVVDTYISQDAVASVEFLNKVERLYGIGAALDPAGTRFSVVLIGLGAVIVEHVTRGAKDNYLLSWYCLAFFIISVLGNMISRTTTVGMGMGLIYVFFGTRVLTVNLSYRALNFLILNVFLITVLLLLATYFYHNNIAVQEQLRFAFEGFFNWVEYGEWRTDSTDKLNQEMWIWPTDTRTWIIGKADFSFGGTGTDIGYCRFIFYSGLVGLTVFSIFFIYNAFVCANRIASYKYFFIFLCILGFVVWLKIPTDLFMMYALIYCLKPETKTYESRLLHSSN